MHAIASVALGVAISNDSQIPAECPLLTIIFVMELRNVFIALFFNHWSAIDWRDRYNQPKQET